MEAGLYFSMSDFVIRPPGPVPLSCERGTPRSRASLLAEGLALGARSRLVCRRPPVEVDSWGSESGEGLESSWSDLGRVDGEVSEPVSAGSDESAASSPDSFFGGSFSPPASSKVNDSKGATSVPSSTMTAIG